MSDQRGIRVTITRADGEVYAVHELAGSVMLAAVTAFSEAVDAMPAFDGDGPEEHDIRECVADMGRLARAVSRGGDS